MAAPQRGEQGLGQRVRRPHVGAVLRVQVVDRGRLDRTHRVHAGAVHQDVDRAVVLQQLAHQVVDAHGDIDGVAVGAVADVSGSCLQCGGRATHQRDGRTGRRQRLSDGPSDTTATAGHDTHAAGQLDVRRPKFHPPNLPNDTNAMVERGRFVAHRAAATSGRRSPHHRSSTLTDVDVRPTARRERDPIGQPQRLDLGPPEQAAVEAGDLGSERRTQGE
jgi:hypothetical protein